MRNCAYQEMCAVVRFNESIATVKRVERILSDNYPKNNGLKENTIMVRKMLILLKNWW